MGQKVNPRVFRLGTVRTWPSRWFARKQLYAATLRQDTELRRFVKRTYTEAGVSQVEIERSPNAVVVTVHAAKPGIIIGRGGQGIEDLKKKLQKQFLANTTGLNIRIQEISQPAQNADIVVQQIAVDLEKRIPFRRALRQALGRIERSGALGARILVKGRLNGAEIARAEKVGYGKVPLHTLRANVEYSRGAAHTIYGAIGIKVWIYLGEVFEEKK